jgi:alpha-L-fucosidase
MASAQTQVNKRAEWFVNDRFGMFVHWGVYSGAEGYWKGEKIRNDNDYSEWIQYRNRIDKEEYLTLLNRFDWEKIDPEEWVVLAKKAGMKYVTLTAKHHDGFALWNSAANAYNIATYAPGRDIVKELSEACKKHGLKMGLYYSHWVDWEHPYGWDHTKEIYPISAENYDQYWQKKVMPQMRELLTNYGDIGLIWFDMWVHHSETIVSKAQLGELKNMIRELQPNCLINSRLGLSIEEEPDVDFRTLGDNQLGNFKFEYPWQTPATVAHSWGFHATEEKWKSTSTLLRNLIYNVALNGNMMLNIGPRANGEVPHEIESRLLEMGDWLADYGASIYGAKAFDLPVRAHDWGTLTTRTDLKGKTLLYLHVFNWPLENKLTLTGIVNAPTSVYPMNKTDNTLAFDFAKGMLQINLPKKAPNPYASVLVLEYDQYPEVWPNVVAETVTGGFSLAPKNAKEILVDIQPKSHNGTIPEFVEVTQKSEFSWEVVTNTSEKTAIDLSYACSYENPHGKITLTIDNKTMDYSIISTPKTVGEPNQNWVIDSFESHRLGEFDLIGSGKHTISLLVEPQPEKPLKFQWLWIQKLAQ